MLLTWIRQRRRKKIMARPFPAEWNPFLAQNVRHVSRLPDAKQQQLRNFVQVFVAEKYWEGCNGFQMTDEVKVTIAAQAALIAIGQLPTFFDHVLSILVYPDEYVAKDRDVTAGGIVTERQLPMLGQAEWNGPVVLSWIDVLEGGRGESPGNNLVLHEFAHQLDMANGHLVDGIPPLQSREQMNRWVKLFDVEFRQLTQRCETGQPTLIDCYGAQNPAEFFAVLTEAFFERSSALRQHHSECYQLLTEYFQLDPAAWT